MRWLWEERATGEVLKFLEDSRAGRRTPARAIPGPQGQEGETERAGQASEGEEGDQARPRLLSLCLSFVFFFVNLFSLARRAGA